MTAERLYRLLLHLYPTTVRVEYGEDMIEAFRAAHRDMGTGRVWILIGQDICCSVYLAHMQDVGPGVIHLARRTAPFLLAVALVMGTIVGGVAAWSAPPPDIHRELGVTDLRTGWVGTSLPDGTTKLVPALAVNLVNVGDDPLRRVQLTALFRRVDEATPRASAHIPAISREALTPNAVTRPIILQASLGYIGTESPDHLLLNPHFVDMRVTVLAKRGRTPWRVLGEWPVPRHQLAPQ